MVFIYRVNHPIISLFLDCWLLFELVVCSRKVSVVGTSRCTFAVQDIRCVIGCRYCYSYELWCLFRPNAPVMSMAVCSQCSLEWGLAICAKQCTRTKGDSSVWFCCEKM